MRLLLFRRMVKLPVRSICHATNLSQLDRIASATYVFFLGYKHAAARWKVRSDARTKRLLLFLFKPGSSRPCGIPRRLAQFAANNRVLIGVRRRCRTVHRTKAAEKWSFEQCSTLFLRMVTVDRCDDQYGILQKGIDCWFYGWIVQRWDALRGIGELIGYYWGILEVGSICCSKP